MEAVNDWPVVATRDSVVDSAVADSTLEVMVAMVAVKVDSTLVEVDSATVEVDSAVVAKVLSSSRHWLGHPFPKEHVCTMPAIP